MNSRPFEEMYLSSQWLSLVQSQQSFALTMASMCSSEFAELILAETQKVINQPPPMSPDGLALRQRQSGALTARVSTIAYADSMARITPTVRSQILQATQEYCSETPVPRSESEFQQAQHAAANFSGKVSQICAGSWSPQI